MLIARVPVYTPGNDVLNPVFLVVTKFVNGASGDLYSSANASRYVVVVVGLNVPEVLMNGSCIIGKNAGFVAIVVNVIVPVPMAGVIVVVPSSFVVVPIILL